MDRCSSSPAIIADNKASSIKPPQKVRRATTAGIRRVYRTSLRSNLTDTGSDFESVVTINAGIKPVRKTFVLHSHALRNSSNFFAIAVDVNCAVAEDYKPINLPDITVEDFNVYAKFLYTSLLFTKEANVAELARCFHLYKVENHLEAMDFRDAIVDALIETILDFRALKGQCRFTAAHITTIYAMTEEGSPLRRFAQNLCLQTKGLQGFEKKRLKDFSVDFQLDLLTAAAPYITSCTKSADMPDPLVLEKSCKYHEHTALSTACYKTKYQYEPDEPVVVTANLVPKPPPAPITGRQSELQTERLASHASNDFELRV